MIELYGPKATVTGSVEDEQPEFETINGVQIPTRQMEDWNREFRRIRLSSELHDLTDWLTRKSKLPEGRYISFIASKLAAKDADEERKDREMRYRADAEAKHGAKQAMRRPAI